MLVLTREENESIVIDKAIEVTILSVRGGKVRLGIDAPRSVTVHRKEIQIQIDKKERRTDGVESDNPGNTY